MRGFWPDIPDMLASERLTAPPSAKRITEMDQALGWISLIPAAMIDLRKLVGLRSLTSPWTEKPIHSWRALGEQFHCSHVTAKSHWLDGIRLITAALNRPLFCAGFRSGHAALDDLRRVARNRDAVTGHDRKVLERA